MTATNELAQINDAARGGGNDVALDALILRLHAETACRRGGALGLRLMDLDVCNGQIRLTEKGSTQRWQPITLDLAQITTRTSAYPAAMNSSAASSIRWKIAPLPRSRSSASETMSWKTRLASVSTTPTRFLMVSAQMRCGAPRSRSGPQALTLSTARLSLEGTFDYETVSLQRILNQ